MSDAELGELDRAVIAIKDAVREHTDRAVAQACLVMVAHLLVASNNSLDEAEAGVAGAADTLSILVRTFWEADRSRDR